MNSNVSATNSFDNVRVRSRGDLRNASSTLDPNFADTGNFYATSQTLLSPELAIVWGPWFFQSEWPEVGSTGPRSKCRESAEFDWDKSTCKADM